MAETQKKQGRPKVYKAKVGGVISKGDGSYFEEGEALPKDADIKSLQAKGFI